MEVEYFATIDISTIIYEDINDGKDIEGVGVHSFHLGFLHNPSILKVKILSKEKTDFSIPTNGFLGWTCLNDLESNFSEFLFNLWKTTSTLVPAMPFHNQKLRIFQKWGVVNNEIPLCSFKIALNEVERLICETWLIWWGEGLYFIATIFRGWRK